MTKAQRARADIYRARCQIMGITCTTFIMHVIQVDGTDRPMLRRCNMQVVFLKLILARRGKQDIVQGRTFFVRASLRQPQVTRADIDETWGQETQLPNARRLFSLVLEIG